MSSGSPSENLPVMENELGGAESTADSILEPNPIPGSENDIAVQEELVKLQVGERHFETTSSTLAESTFFKTLLSDTWRHGARPDGSFGIDRDGDLFEHVLRYLRSTVLPIFYDKAKGHDEVLYSMVLVEADFYGISRLKKWIKERGYLKAVKVTISTSVTDYDHIDHLLGGRPSPKALGIAESESESDVEVQHHSMWTSRKIYVCPRRILGHMGNSSACGRKCNNAKGGRNEYADLPIFRVTEVKKKTVIDRDLCLEG